MTDGSDPNDPTKYKRLAAAIRSQITNGTIRYGRPAPTITNLAVETGWSRQTCSRALDMLDMSVGGSWNGPAAIGNTGTTYSAPATVFQQSTGLTQVFAQGPSNSLNTWWESGSPPWNGPVMVPVGGANTTYSAP
jgi:DNA-binding transcriptional MocR family regulator